MKLCRFELKSEPGTFRSGIVYSGKVYETDGSQPIAIHEAADVRPLAPIASVPSIRFFSAVNDGREPDDLPYTYGNPGSIAGPSQVIATPVKGLELAVVPYLACVVVDGGYRLDFAEVDRAILGYTLVNVLTALDLNRQDDGTGMNGRAYDLGVNMGPVITTPDELADVVIDSESGINYALGYSLRVNGVDKAKGDWATLQTTFQSALVSASLNATLRSGDVIAIGPLFPPELCTITPSDEVALSVERLGVLSTKVLTDPDL